MANLNDTINDYLTIANSLKDISGVIVSVGSGMGHTESFMRNNGNVVICVDPYKEDKDLYVPITRKLPSDYAYVRDLVNDKPNIVGKTTVFLNYPLTDYIIYDIFSIYTLEPKKIVLFLHLDTKNRCSGSYMLHRFLRKNGVRSTVKLGMDKQCRENGLNDNVCPIRFRYDLKDIRECLDGYLITLDRGEEIRKKSELDDAILTYEPKFEQICIGYENTLKMLNLNVNLLTMLNTEEQRNVLCEYPKN